VGFKISGKPRAGTPPPPLRRDRKLEVVIKRTAIAMVVVASLAAAYMFVGPDQGETPPTQEDMGTPDAGPIDASAEEAPAVAPYTPKEEEAVSYREKWIRILQDFVFDYLAQISGAGNYKVRLDDALAMVPIMVDEALSAGMNPMLVITVAVTESSLTPGILGWGGEMGVMQVMPSSRYPKKSLVTVQGQINAGVRKLKEALVACPKSTTSALGYYLTGRCGGARKAATRRAEEYYEARAVYAKGAR